MQSAKKENPMAVQVGLGGRPTMKYGLLFDCDGVLVDSHNANYFSYLSALEKIVGGSIRRVFTPDAFAGVWGKPWREWLRSYAFDAVEQVHRIKVKNYSYYLSQYGEILPGLNILRKWHNSGVPTAIVSNASAGSIEQLLCWLETAGDFGFLRDVQVITPTREIQPKPGPKIIKRACAQLQVESGILIDDDLSIGKETAQRADIPFIHYTNDPVAINKKIGGLLA